MAKQKNDSATSDTVREMAETYVELVRNDQMGGRLQAHMKQAIFEEAVEAHGGPDIWMELNILQSN